MSLKNRFKVREDIKSKIEKEDSSGDDSRILPFYKMKDGEKMEVLIIPDVEGNIWKKYKVHGANLNVRSAGRVRCIHEANGEPCPVCQKAFDDLDAAPPLEKNVPNPERDKAKRWFAKDYTLASVVVLESPVEIPDSEDGNQIKLWYVPYKVEESIKQMIKENQITYDEIPSTPFVIKKTTNQGGRAAYDHSYFSREQVDLDEIFEDMEDDELVQYDFAAMSEDTEDDLIPSPPTLDEAEEWLDKAIDKVAESDKKSGSSEGGSGESKRESAKSKIKNRRRGAGKSRDPEAEEEESNEEEEPRTLDDDEAGREAAESMKEEEGEEEEEAPRKKRGLRSLKRRRSLKSSSED